MKELFRSIAAGILLLFCWMALSSPVLPQTSTTQTPPAQPPPPSPAKKKKVWTEEDLRRIHGGVNVVGEADKAPAKGKKAVPGDTAKAEEALEEEPPERPPCASWSWAAAVDAVLSAQGVNLGREYWVMRTYGGAICTTALGDIASLANRVAGDYTLDDGSKVRIKADVFPGLFNDLVGSQENSGIAHIVAWKGHPYLVTGYTGTKVYVNGALAGYEMKTLTMTDPYEDRSVRFDRAKDSLQEFQGTVRFVVTRR